MRENGRGPFDSLVNFNMTTGLVNFIVCTRAPKPGAKKVSPWLLATTRYNPRGLRPLGLYRVVTSNHGLTYT